MADFTAKDVQKRRQASGAGMMDAKKALDEASGDFESAFQALVFKTNSLSSELQNRVARILVQICLCLPN